MFLFDLLILIISLFIIGLISDKFITYVTRIAEILGLSQMAAGFLLLSMSTSLPELLVSIMASLMGEGGLSFGNVLGSNIANLTFVMGLAVFISRVRVSVNQESQRDIIQFLFLSSIIPLFVVQIGSLSLALSAILLVLFVYFSFLISKKASTTTIFTSHHSYRDNFLVGIKFFISLAIIIIASRYVVDSSINVADFFGIPPSIIGATMVGLGTSIPELATSIQTLRKGMYDMALGNLIGSCITNLTLILGAASLVSFSSVNIVAAGSIMFFLILSTMTMWYIVSAKKDFGRRTAIILILMYIMFVLQELGIIVIF